MAKTSFSGPVIAFGQELVPPGLTTLSANRNPDRGPSMFDMGVAILDPRAAYAFYPGQAAGSQPVVGWLNSDVISVDFAPATLATTNIALAQATTGAALTLTAGAGVTGADSIIDASTGATVTGLLRIDAKPALIAYGSSALLNVWDPATVAGRAVSLTSAGNLSGINITVAGYDVYRMPMTCTLAGPNANTVNTLKGFKWIKSVTPSATMGGVTMSVGTADIFTFPLRADYFAYTYIIWDNIVQAVAQFTAADATNPATAATGDVRGKYTVTGNASNGTRRLQVFQTIAPASIGTVAGMLGITQV